MTDFTMMIVDDEPISRYTVLGLVSKKFPEISIVAEAEDGNEAVEKAAEYSPDIIIMDMKIPILNGIEAGKIILEKNPDSKIIALTAFDEFDFAKDALNAGFCGFLLKPVDTDQFVEAVQKCISILSNGQTKDTYSKSRTVKFITNEFFSVISAGCSEKLKIENYFNLLKIDFKHGYFITAGATADCAKIDDEAVEQLSREYKKLLPGTFLFGSCKNNSVTIFDYNRKKDAACIDSIFELNHRMQIKYKLKLAFGISEDYENPVMLSHAINECELAFNEAVKDHSVVHIKELDDSSKRKYPEDMESLVIDHLRTRDLNWIHSNKKNIIDNIIPDNANLLNIKENCVRFLMSLKSSNLISILFSHEYSYIQQVYSINNKSELRLLLSRYIELLTINRDDDQEKEDQFISQMNKYIDNNIVREITLESAAQAAGLSSSYFSKIFKEYTGFNFIDYITRKRILTAKKMLTRTNKRIKDIAGDVGFQDSAYFSKLFKKSTGFTPADFRKNHRREIQ